MQFYKVVQQQILGEVVDFIPALSAVRLRMWQRQIIKIGHHLAKLIAKIRRAHYLWLVVYVLDQLMT